TRVAAFLVASSSKGARPGAGARQAHRGTCLNALKEVFHAPPRPPGRTVAVDHAGGRPGRKGAAVPGPRARGLGQGDHRPAAVVRPGHEVEGDGGTAVRAAVAEAGVQDVLLLRPAVLAARRPEGGPPDAGAGTPDLLSGARQGRLEGEKQGRGRQRLYPDCQERL